MVHASCREELWKELGDEAQELYVCGAVVRY